MIEGGTMNTGGHITLSECLHVARLLVTVQLHTLHTAFATFRTLYGVAVHSARGYFHAHKTRTAFFFPTIFTKLTKLNSITCSSLIQNFTPNGKWMWRVAVTFHLRPSVKMAFTAPIFVKLVFTQHILVDISCNEYYTNQSRNVESAGRNVFRPSNAVWPSCSDL
jgi:hypothetical protein